MERATPTAGALVAVDATLRLCSPRGGVRRTTYLSDTIWIERTSAAVASDGRGEVTVLRRTEAEALAPPQNGGAGPDGFDAKRFGPSGRRMWMFDTGYSDTEAAAQYGRMRMRTDDDISKS